MMSLSDYSVICKERSGIRTILSDGIGSETRTHLGIVVSFTLVPLCIGHSRIGAGLEKSLKVGHLSREQLLEYTSLRYQDISPTFLTGRQSGKDVEHT